MLEVNDDQNCHQSIHTKFGQSKDYSQQNSCDYRNKKGSDANSILHLSYFHEEDSFCQLNSMDIEPEIPVCAKFANSGLKPTKFMTDITKGRIIQNEDKTLPNDEPIFDKIKSFFTDIWPFTDCKDGELPSSIPHISTNNNNLNSDGDQLLNSSLIPRVSDSVESLQSQD